MNELFSNFLFCISLGIVRGTIQKFTFRSLSNPQPGLNFPACVLTDFITFKRTCTFRPEYSINTEIFIRNCGEFFVYFIPPLDALNAFNPGGLIQGGVYCAGFINKTQGI